MSGPSAITKMELARETCDCSVASLAMYLGHTYEDVLRAVAVIDAKHQGRAGLTDTQIRRVAAALGTRLHLRRYFDPDDSYGILRLEDHTILLRNGLVFEVDGTVWDVTDYLTAKDMKPLGLFIAEDA